MNLHDLEHHHEFHARHIGPNDAEIAEMLAAVGATSLDGLVDAIVPSSIKLTAPLALPGAVTEEEALAQDPDDRRRQPRPSQLHRPGLLRHRDAQGHPAQHPREPRLVHRLHALPGRDLAGPDGSTDQLPDDGRGSHRHGDRERLAARRGHRRGRGDDAREAQREEQEQGLHRRRRLPSADDRGDPHARRAARHRDQGGLRPGPDEIRRLLRRARAVPGDRWADPRHAAVRRAGACGGRVVLRRRRPAGADAARGTREPGAPTSSSAIRSDSACRSGSADRMLRSWPARMRSSARWRDGWSVCRSTRRDSPPIA